MVKTYMPVWCFPYEGRFVGSPIRKPFMTKEKAEEWLINELISPSSELTAELVENCGTELANFCGPNPTSYGFGVVEYYPVAFELKIGNHIERYLPIDYGYGEPGYNEAKRSAERVAREFGGTVEETVNHGWLD